MSNPTTGPLSHPTATRADVGQRVCALWRPLCAALRIFGRWSLPPPRRPITLRDTIPTFVRFRGEACKAKRWVYSAVPRGPDQLWPRAPRMRRCRRTRRKAAQGDLRSVADTSGNVDDLPRCAWRAVPCRRVRSLGGEYVFLWENEGHRRRAFVPGWASLSGLWATTAGGCALELIFSRNYVLCPAS